MRPLALTIVFSLSFGAMAAQAPDPDPFKDDYKGYIRAWDALHARYRKFSYLTDRVTELRDTELNKAQRGANLVAFRLHERAGKLAKAGNVQGARALYNRIINHFGFESIVARAKEARDKLPSP